MSYVQYKKKYFSQGMDEPEFRVRYRDFIEDKVSTPAWGTVKWGTFLTAATFLLAATLLVVFIVGVEVFSLLQTGHMRHGVNNATFFVDHFNIALFCSVCLINFFFWMSAGLQFIGCALLTWGLGYILLKIFTG